MSAPDPRISEWLDALAAITDEPPGLTRTFLSPALELAKAQTAQWMRAAGMSVHEDQAGNLIGRVDCGDATAGTVACGSHLDTVRNAGRFDGAMGVVAAILAAERAAARGPLPYHLEVVAFSDEEGVRFHTTYLGSRFYTGRLWEAERACADAEGITVAQAIAAHTPKFPAPVPRRLLGYVEAHIEQGPVLESVGLPLGLVTAITGQTRARVTITGRAGHAGTTPMALRRDALTGAAECVLLAEEMAKREPGLVATVGQLELAAPASNVIPGEAWFTLDIRDPDDAARERFRRRLFSEIQQRMEARGLATRIETALDSPAVACDSGLGDALARVVERTQGQCPRLVSGAGHDAVVLAEVTRAAMLFVRCRDGSSHHPDEFATAEDIALATDVLAEFLGNFPA